MTADRFEATFVVKVERETVWQRLTSSPLEPAGDAPRYWVPGFDSAATLDEAETRARLRLTKDDEPCAGTEIVVVLEDDTSGTRVTVVQSRFGDWLPARYDMMTVGWRYIVADLETFLATGAHARRHLRAWGDLGADVRATDGGLRLHAVRPGTLADRLGLRSDDLLVVLAGAPVASYDDLVTVLRVLGAERRPVEAEWVRGGTVLRAVAS
jgi:hypothetical protein